MAHVHGHGQGGGHHHHHAAPEKMNKVFAIAVIANLLFTAIEAVYAIFANSMSLLADAGHNLGDVLGLLFAWAASWLMTLPASRKYSYGFKRTSMMAALSNALLLVAASGVIIYESIVKLIHPSPVDEKVVIIVAAIGIVVNGATAALFVKGHKDDLNIKGAFLHLASDALISVGVVIVGIVILYTHWLWLDPVVGIAIVIAILMN